MSKPAQHQKNWDGPVDYTYPGLTLAVLVEIRDELRQLNRVFSCSNFLRIPRDLQQIRRNTNRPKKVGP